jgi:hypothetical protein
VSTSPSAVRRRPQVVLVVGPGRSGTSAVAGALAHSGFHVPGSIGGRAANPRGFFEPRWLVDFDRDRLRAAGVHTLDSDPEAATVLLASLDREDAKARLTRWLTELIASGRRLVLKDPRLVWFEPLWVELAEELGIDLGFLVMMRHPSEVSASRNAHYDTGHARAVAGWVNVALMTERITRGSRRTLVHYPDLVSDWRAEMRRIDAVLGLDLQPAIEQVPHPIDEFLDPALRRMPHGWDGLAVPRWLRDLADRTFDALKAVADGGEPAAYDTLDALTVEYADAFEAAVAITRPRFVRDRRARRAAQPWPVESKRRLRVPRLLRRTGG